MAEANATVGDMFSALAEANRAASRRNTAISVGCFTCYVSRTGEAGGAPHEIVATNFGGMAGFGAAAKNLLDSHFGAGKYALRQFTAVKSEDTDDYHETRLRDKPNDSETHSNYGNHLLNSKNDVAAAERAYIKALDLDPKNANALGNLANVKVRNGEIDAARVLYQNALEIAPQHENVTWCYGNFLISQNDRTAARQVLNRGIDGGIQDTRRIRLALANLDLLDRNVAAALEGFRCLREQGADQKEVECGIALALQMSGAPIDQCIDAYRTAVALNPDSGGLLLNLAQLLLAKGSMVEGEKKLHEALRLELDLSARVEGQFYLLAHTTANPRDVFDAIGNLRGKGAKLDWNVQPNIDAVRKNSVESADILALLADVLAEPDGSASIDSLVRRWQTRRS
jgi:Tfp pilus assembly protein PilF